MAKDTFPQRVRITGLAALERASALILAYRQELAAAESALQAEIAALRQKFAPRFACRVGKITLPIEDRIRQLEEAVTRFTDQRRGRIFTEGKKTAQVGEVNVQLRDEAARIEFLPGMNRRTSAAAIVARATGFQTAFAKLLVKFGLAGWIVPQWDLDWDGIKRARKNETITDADLEAAGMYWTAPTRVRLSRKTE